VTHGFALLHQPATLPPRLRALEAVPTENRGIIMKPPASKPDDLPFVFYSSEHRCSPTQAKKKEEIADRKNYFFDLSVLP